MYYKMNYLEENTYYPINGSLGGPQTSWRKQNSHVCVRIQNRNLQHTAKWIKLFPLHCKTVKNI